MSTITGSSYREWFNNQYRNEDSTYNSSNGNSNKTNGVNYGDAKFTDKKENGVSVDDFLNLMVAQLKNQDFMNPVDDTQYVAQLAQFATMQQMQELASYSKSNYAMSLIGKTVTAANFTISGKLEKTTGAVTKISLVENEYHIYIGDKSFTMEQIMEIGGTAPTTTEETDYAKAAYLQSLVGKNVTVNQINEDGTKEPVTGNVDHISMADGKYLFFIGDKSFSLEQLLQINSDKTDEDSDVDAPGNTTGGGTGDVTNPDQGSGTANGDGTVDTEVPEVDVTVPGTNGAIQAPIDTTTGGGLATDETQHSDDITASDPTQTESSGVIEV